MLASITLMAFYVDQDDHSKGFSVEYAGGDFCENVFSDSRMIYNFRCDPDIELNVEKVDVKLGCFYEFDLKTKYACSYLPPKPGAHFQFGGSTPESQQGPGFLIGFLTFAFKLGSLAALLYGVWLVKNGFETGDQSIKREILNPLRRHLRKWAAAIKRRF